MDRDSQRPYTGWTFRLRSPDWRGTRTRRGVGCFATCARDFSQGLGERGVEVGVACTASKDIRHGDADALGGRHNCSRILVIHTDRGATRRDGLGGGRGNECQNNEVNSQRKAEHSMSGRSECRTKKRVTLCYIAYSDRERAFRNSLGGGHFYRL